MSALVKKTYSPLERLLGSFWDEDCYTPKFNLDTLPTRTWSPTLDIEETDKSYVVKADLPGLKKEEITIKTDRDYLTISGERQTTKKEDKKGYRYVERSHGTFSRSVHLPPNVLEEKIEATYTDGVLEVTIPKTTGETVKRITIH